jgi:hemolysin activation/secretion protein
VETAMDATVTGNVGVDNYGNRYTGKTRAGGTVNFVNPLHYGDVLSASVLASDSGMDYERISYDALLDGRGTRAGGAYSAVHYVLGDTMTPLLAHGTAQVDSLWLKQPFVRSREVNLYGQLQYDQKQLRDRIDASSVRTDRHLGNWVLSLSGDLRDTLLSGGINTWSLGWTSGRVGFDDAAAQAADAATARTQGGFSKWNVNFSRLQALTKDDELYVTVAGQWSNANLDSAEKMSVGGPYTVRAYDMGAMSGDTGYMGSAELHHWLGVAFGQWQASLFVDSAHVTVNRNQWVTGANSATLNGAGIGLNWIGGNQWHAKAYVASRLGSTPTLVADTSSTRTWVEIGKGF